MSAKFCSMRSRTSGPVVGRQLGVHPARFDQRDAHVALGDLLAQRLAERAHAVLCEVVDARARPGHPARHGADVDHVGHASWPVVCRAQQVGQRGVGAVEQAGDVHIEHPPPLLQRGVLDRAEQHHAGVIDQRVQPSQLPDRALNGLLRLLLGADVGLDRERFAAVCSDPLGEVVESVAAAGHQGHRRPEPGQGQGGRLADAAGGPGDERDGAAELVG